MKVFDISQEILSCEVYSGDPKPKLEKLVTFEEGNCYSLSAISMCLHNGTHVDAPRHFFEDGKTVEETDLNRFVGFAEVIECSGILKRDQAIEIVNRAKSFNNESKRILLKGEAEVSSEAARVFKGEKLYLLGTQLQSFGPYDEPMEVHKILLEEGMILLEGIRLEKVEEGSYLLCAAPLNIEGAEGSPTRAILIKL